MEANLDTTTNEGRKEASFMNVVNQIKVLCTNVQDPRDLIKPSNIMVDGVLAKREWLWLS